MANAITLAQQFIPVLDEIYKNASLTSVLDGAADLARQGANANELIIPKLDMQGLGDYNRNSGYVSGDVTLTNETVKCNFDRGRMFQVDYLDNLETAGIAFGRLSGEFIRTKVVPELDAFRFACYASATGISKVSAGATLSDGAGVVAALRAAVNKMDEDEVPSTERYLFITPTLYGMVQDLDTTKSREVMENFASIVKVPQTRFYTAIEQLDGTTGGEEAGGYKKGTGAADINFKADSTWEWGNYVRVDDKDGNRLFFCHMASRAVKVGQKVNPGDKLGVMGNTGYSFGAHTHFEVRKSDGRTTLDPAAYLGVPNAKGTYTEGKTGWVQASSAWYWYEDGEPVQNRWVEDGGWWYRLGPDGKMLTGLVEVDGKGYCLNPERKTVGGIYVPEGACIVTDKDGAIAG